MKAKKGFLAEILSGFFVAGNTVRYPEQNRKYRFIELAEFR
jgi:hypothetical protein